MIEKELINEAVKKIRKFNLHDQDMTYARDKEKTMKDWNATYTAIATEIIDLLKDNLKSLVEIDEEKLRKTIGIAGGEELINVLVEANPIKWKDK